MSIRRLKITEKELRIGNVTYYAGDVKSFPKAEADEYIRLGWAEDGETGETGERVEGSAPIHVASVVQPGA